MGQGEVEFHDYKTTEQAISQLKKEDVLKLTLFVKCKLFNVPSDVDANDLINEAVARTLAQERRWNKKLSIFSHLAGVIRSICSDHWRSQEGKNQARQFSISDDDRELIANQTPLRVLELQNQDLIEKLKSSWDDQLTQKVLEYVLDGVKRQHAIFELQIDEKQYDTCRKRIIRKIIGLKDRDML